MNRIVLPALLLLAATPAMAAPGGAMWTVPQGRWTCELPGDATTPPTPRPEHNFSVVPDSSYVVGGMRGTYLLLGKKFTMTSGPFAGRRFDKVGLSLIKLGPDGKREALRCVRAGAVRDDYSAGDGEPTE
ncbi:hypothetical protein [Novosphingobium sp.]|uniref:hypothetical protein n=1 Tax=Novosphingobium sp. TaxID=1874826 RepID=UPI001D546D33|nr:hypothetical protein [Novosphingobium sp.]MBX9665438.1 hypothetical protein [Novosphingobium sp.]